MCNNETTNIFFINNLNLSEMKRKDYQKPTTKVVLLQHQPMLMTGSPLDATRNDYGDAEELLWQ